MFDFTFDPETETLVYERSADTWFNITNFILSPDCPGCFSVLLTSWDPDTGTLKFETTVNNPTEVMFYALRAVFLFPNDSFSLDDPDLYNDWYNDGIGPALDPVRSLSEQTTWPPTNDSWLIPHYDFKRSWVMHLPTGQSESKQFKFIIEIFWPGKPVEPYYITNAWEEPEGALYTDCGELKYYIRVYDHQNDVADVTIDTDALGMGVVEMTKVDEYIWQVILHNEAHVGSGRYPLLVTVTDSVSDKKVYNKFNVTVEETGVITNPQLECVWNLWPNFPPGTPSGTNRQYMSGNILWVKFYEEGWLAFDISDPSNPLPMGTPRELIHGLHPTPSPFQGLWAVGNGFALWNGEYPPAPLQTRVYNLTGNPIPDIASPDYIVPLIPGVYNDISPDFLGVFGDVAVIRSAENGYYAAILDLSNPDNPTYTDIFGPGENFYRCYDLTDKWIVLGDNSHLEVYSRPSNSDDPASLVLDTPDLSLNVFMAGDVLYFTDALTGDQTLKRWSYNQGEWAQLSSLNLLPDGTFMDQPGSWMGKKRVNEIYKPDGSEHGLAVIDFTDPLEPKLINTYWGKEYEPFLLRDMPSNVLITGYGEYMMPGLPHEGGIWFRDPDNPEIVLGKIDYNIDGMAQSVDVVDNIAVLAEGSIGLLVADVSTLPALPKFLSRIEAGTGPDMFVKLHKSASGLAAYTLSKSVGIAICDLNSPENPFVTTILNHPDANEIDCNDQYLAVATFDGVALYDLADPFHPFYMGNVYPMDDNDGRVWDVNFEGNALWARTDTSIVRYDLTTAWPFESEYRTSLHLPIGWINAHWPFLVDGAQTVPNEEYGPWIYPIDGWQNFPAQQMVWGQEAGRIAIDAPYYFQQAGPLAPLMDGLWGSILIYNCSDFINTYPYYPDYIGKAFIPEYQSGTLTIYGGPEFIVKDNRVFMARDMIDLATVRLW
ncbi:MAG: hypothetical protein NTY09_04595 [bacterium]|nr:hypothetical protein [bacterium]